MFRDHAMDCPYMDLELRGNYFAPFVRDSIQASPSGWLGMWLIKGHIHFCIDEWVRKGEIG